MKKISIFLMALLLSTAAFAQSETSIKLKAPNQSRPATLMKAFANRHSEREFTEKNLSTQDLSDLLWAAFGINRPDGKRTAASAMNAQDVEIYAFMDKGIYLYNAKDNLLTLVKEGDHRYAFAMGPRPGGPAPANAPAAAPKAAPAAQTTPAMILVLVSDLSKFGQIGDDALHLQWGCIDVGLVSQNISLFCSSNGMATRPRAGMDKDAIGKLLNLPTTKVVILNQPVSYVKK